ncbi:hypothetical protein MMC26_001745 [Xylographa opegraphella]|nr:hypothetical protein [Xylographa opegraphella]
MSDDIRRSGRATKGQHTKNVDEPDGPPPKRGKAGRPPKASKQVSTPPEEEEEKEEPAIIRCICGYVVEDEDDERTMVICDNCSAWQHNICMGISEDPDDLPEQYFCEQCRPEDHKELLDAMARGETPWVERELQRQRDEQEKKGRKRKVGKRGRKPKSQETKPEKPRESKGATTLSPTVPPPQVFSTPTKPEISQKRKLSEESTTQTVSIDEHQPSSKIRKISIPKDVKSPPQRRQSSAMAAPIRQDSMGGSLQAELVESISDLQSETRRKAAGALVKLFVEQTQQAQKQGVFKVPPGQSPDAFGLRLGLAVEYAIYLYFWGHSEEPKQEYSGKLRMMLHNVKANPTLRDRLLTGSLSPEKFSQMSSHDMASKELQEKTAEIIKEVEKQHLLIQEEGPRIRRTHKGEELVGDDTQQNATTEPSFTNPPSRRRESMADAAEVNQITPLPKSPRSPNAVELPSDVLSAGAGMSLTNGKPLTVDTKVAPRSSLAPERKSSSAFNIQNVWSSVDSPDADKQRVRQSTQQPSRSMSDQVTGLGVQADEDIDHLLKDEDPDDEEPYSPTDFDAEPGMAWRGNLTMPSVAGFRGSGRHVAGADLSSVYSWTQLIPHSLHIEGRIDVEKATQYLCGLQWSKTTDVSVISIMPNDNQADQEQFNKLFDYFTERKRYGVISKSPVTTVRDVYLVPLEAGTAKKPEFIELLEYCTLEEPRPTRMLLITYVIKTKTDTTSSAQATPRHPEGGMIASPISTQVPGQYRNPSLSNAGAQMSPVSAYGNVSYGSPAQHQQPFTTPQRPYSPAYNISSNGANPTGMEAARQVLGDMAGAPVVSELLSQAPGTGLVEFGHIKEVMESVPACHNNFEMFMGLLAARSQQGSVGLPTGS